MISRESVKYLIKNAQRGRQRYKDEATRERLEEMLQVLTALDKALGLLKIVCDAEPDLWCGGVERRGAVAISGAVSQARELFFNEED